MPYDPNFPTANTLADAAQVRGQFNAIKALIDAIVTIIAAQIAGVSTLNPGESAAVTVTVIGDTLHFTFAIPRGADGADGAPGAQGPPFAQAIVDAVNTLAPGSNATVSASFDGVNVHFTIGIPAGVAGADGIDGEVTNAAMNAALDAAIAGTSNNTNAVATLDTPFADPNMEAMRQKLNEHILAARRA